MNSYLRGQICPSFLVQARPFQSYLGSKGEHKTSGTCPRAISSWDRLGISRNCTIDEAKLAYRRLMLKVHPDLHNGDEDKTKEAILLNDAYVDVLVQLSRGENSVEVDIFDECRDEEPDVLFVNPLLCYDIPHVHWYDIQLLAQELGEVEFCTRMIESDGVRIPEEAFIYLTNSQHLRLMEELSVIQNEVNYTAVEAFEYFLVDCLARAKKANR